MAAAEPLAAVMFNFQKEHLFIRIFYGKSVLHDSLKTKKLIEEFAWKLTLKDLLLLETHLEPDLSKAETLKQSVNIS